MNSKYVLLLLSVLFSQGTYAQDNNVFDVSLELQGYPTGVIPGIRFEKGFSEQHSVHLRLGYQEIRHEDWGVHQDERGDGYGFTLGYRYYLQPGFQGWSLGFRTDVWFNQLDWTDNIGQTNEVRGRTDVTVIQPTVQTGYLYQFNKRFFLRPTAAMGFEINVDTDGEDVGEGFIVLLGIEAGHRW